MGGFMKDCITKYLVMKMFLGLGYSASKEEINKLTIFLNSTGINVDLDFDHMYVENMNDVYYANYRIEPCEISIFDIEESKLLREFAINYSNQIVNEEEAEINEEYKSRAENLAIYLVSAINYVKKLKNDKKSLHDFVFESFSVSETEPVENYNEIFTKLTNNLAIMMEQENVRPADDLAYFVVCNTDPRSGYNSYKAYCNYRVLNSALDNELSNVFGKDISFALKFGGDDYYGVPTCEQDSIIVVNNCCEGDLFGPIYLCQAESEHRIDEKVKSVEFARRLMKKYITSGN